MSHILQALDYQFFKVFKLELKKHWVSYVEEVVKITIKDSLNNKEKISSNADVNRYKILPLIVDMLKRTATTKRIEESFRYTGLFPWNSSLPLSNNRIRDSEITFKDINQNKKIDRIDINAKCISSETVLKEIESKKKKIKSRW